MRPREGQGVGVGCPDKPDNDRVGVGNDRVGGDGAMPCAPYKQKTAAPWEPPFLPARIGKEEVSRLRLATLAEIPQAHQARAQQGHAGGFGDIVDEQKLRANFAERVISGVQVQIEKLSKQIGFE